MALARFSKRRQATFWASLVSVHRALDRPSLARQVTIGWDHRWAMGLGEIGDSVHLGASLATTLLPLFKERYNFRLIDPFRQSILQKQEKTHQSLLPQWSYSIKGSGPKNTLWETNNNYGKSHVLPRKSTIMGHLQ